MTGLISLAKPLGGSAFAFSLLVLPLGNYSLGLALAFALGATCWLILNRREPLTTQLPLLGPFAAVFGALFLLPLALLPIRGAGRRALIGASAFSLTAVVAGLNGGPLPLTGEKAPRGLGIEGSNNLISVAGALARALADRPALLAEGLLLGLAAALLPLAQRKGRWGSAVFASGMIALALLPFPSVAAIPVITGAWLTALALVALPASVSSTRPIASAPAETPALETRRIAV
jgi:hypothetical protein